MGVAVDLSLYSKQVAYCTLVCSRSCVGWLDCKTIQHRYPEFKPNAEETTL